MIHEKKKPAERRVSLVLLILENQYNSLFA